MLSPFDLCFLVPIPDSHSELETPTDISALETQTAKQPRLHSVPGKTTTKPASTKNLTEERQTARLRPEFLSRVPFVPKGKSMFPALSCGIGCVFGSSILEGRFTYWTQVNEALAPQRCVALFQQQHWMGLMVWVLAGFSQQKVCSGQ